MCSSLMRGCTEAKVIINSSLKPLKRDLLQKIYNVIIKVLCKVKMADHRWQTKVCRYLHEHYYCFYFSDLLPGLE
jgi:hypothetical protein